MCKSVSYRSEKHTMELAQNPSSWHSQKHKFKDTSEDRHAQPARTVGNLFPPCVPDALLRKQQVPRCRPEARCKPWAPPIPGWLRQVDSRAPLLSLVLSLVTQAFPSMNVPLSLPLRLHERGPHRWTHASAPRMPFPQGVRKKPVPIAWEYAVGAARKIVQRAERYIKCSVSEFNA